MLTWQQVKQIREKKRRGRVPNWFTKIEEKVLKDNSSREIQEIYKVASLNRNTIKVQIQGTSRDKRKRE